MERCRHEQRASRGVPAIEIEPPDRVRLLLRDVPESKGARVAGSASSSANPFVVLAVRVRELLTRPAELVLELGLRIGELSSKLFVRQPRQVRVRDAVRTDHDTALGERAQLVPVHRCQLVGVVAGQLGNRQRRAVAGKGRAHEDGDRKAEPLEVRKDARRAAKSVVESNAQTPNSRKGTHLGQQQLRLNRQPVLPGRRDGVVTENKRASNGGSWALAPDGPADEDSDAKRRRKEQPADHERPDEDPPAGTENETLSPRRSL